MTRNSVTLEAIDILETWIQSLEIKLLSEEDWLHPSYEPGTFPPPVSAVGDTNEEPRFKESEIIYSAMFQYEDPQGLHQLAIIKNEKCRYARLCIYTTRHRSRGSREYSYNNWHLLKAASVIDTTFLKKDLAEYKRFYLEQETQRLRPIFYLQSIIDELAVKKLNEVCHLILDNEGLPDEHFDLIEDAISLLGSLPDPCIEVSFQIIIPEYVSIRFDTDEIEIMFSSSEPDWTLIRGEKNAYLETEEKYLSLALHQLAESVISSVKAGNLEIITK